MNYDSSSSGMPDTPPLLKQLSSVPRWLSRALPFRSSEVIEPPTPAFVRCPLLGDRQFVSDLAKLAEQLVMDDMPCSYWSDEQADMLDDEDIMRASVDALRMRIHCRERAAWFAPDKIAEVTQRVGSKHSGSCSIRHTRASWAIELQQRYGARVLEWIDSGVGLEKQAAVLLLPRGCPGAKPTIVVCFRGSKSIGDYGSTDVSAVFVPLPWAQSNNPTAVTAPPVTPHEAVKAGSGMEADGQGEGYPAIPTTFIGPAPPPTAPAAPAAPAAPLPAPSTTQHVDGHEEAQSNADPLIVRWRSSPMHVPDSEAGQAAASDQSPAPSVPALSVTGGGPDAPDGRDSLEGDDISRDCLEGDEESRSGLTDGSVAEELRDDRQVCTRDPRVWRVYEDIAQGSARMMPLLKGSERPCVTLGLWRAYAGTKPRCLNGLGPRGQVHRAVERALAEHPGCRVCVTGHSLGGALATLCAVDLLATSTALDDVPSGVTVVAFAAPRFFNDGFKAHAKALERSGRLSAVRVNVKGDVIPSLPPAVLGGAHGISARILLHPRRTTLLLSQRMQDTPAAPPPSARTTRNTRLTEADETEAVAERVTDKSSHTLSPPPPLPPSSWPCAPPMAGAEVGVAAEVAAETEVEADAAPDDWEASWQGALSYCDDESEEEGNPAAGPAVDVHAHTSHAIMLSGAPTLTLPTTRLSTVPHAHAWPLLTLERRGARVGGDAEGSASDSSEFDGK